MLGPKAKIHTNFFVATTKINTKKHHATAKIHTNFFVAATKINAKKYHAAAKTNS